jgi:hypothetical protein
MADDNEGSTFLGEAFLSIANATTVIGVVCAFGSLTVLSTAARFYSRWRYVGLRLDDWFMFVSMLFYVVLCIAVVVGAKNATGQPGMTFANVELAVEVSDLRSSDIQSANSRNCRCSMLAKCFTSSPS